MPSKKVRHIIAAENVPNVFDDARIQELARIAKLPANADLAVFGGGVREAARIFARDARIPTVNQLNAEIAELWRAVDPCRPRRSDRIATMMDNLSAEARALLAKRGARPARRIKLPTAGALRDPKRREDAADTIATLCQFGGRWVEGRRRASGKRSRPNWQPSLLAPDKQPNLPKRDAERDFVMWLQIAWHDVTSAMPPVTARHRDPSRNIGPFARLARECLKLLGAGDVDVVELMNELQRRRRRAMGQRAKRKLSSIKP